MHWELYEGNGCLLIKTIQQYPTIKSPSATITRVRDITNDKETQRYHLGPTNNCHTKQESIKQKWVVSETRIGEEKDVNRRNDGNAIWCKLTARSLVVTLCKVSLSTCLLHASQYYYIR